MRDTIDISGQTADALSLAFDQDFCRVEMPERMAWIVLLMKKLEDKEEYFPFGKWAIIQYIESQLQDAVDLYFEECKATLKCTDCRDTGLIINKLSGEPIQGPVKCECGEYSSKPTPCSACASTGYEYQNVKHPPMIPCRNCVTKNGGKNV